MSRTIELLAPAKDLAAGIAAIDCGADAVYVGASRFSAREAAGNSLTDIAALARHAHRYFARVYAAVNTVLRDDELDEVVRLCGELADAGVDALIVQDVGLLECALPPLPLIASTQMHNATARRVAFLEKVGFSRAILARELDLEGIRAIRAATSLELEVFVHGALCVCMSGRCSLSYAMGGRSGNRGQCAQPCRRGYSLLDGNARTAIADRHLLSLRDLNLTAHLAELLDAGVSSFKIEGRLKNRAYVMNIVGHYRRAIDELLGGRGQRKSSSGQVRLGFSPNPDKTFNRGYTTYFLHGRGVPVASPESPKHVGEPLGKVAALGRDSFTLEAPVALQSGDGITFYGRGNQLEGSTINRVQGERVFPQTLTGLARGARVFRNHDHAFAAVIAKSRPRREIAVDLVLGETARGLRLDATDEDGVRATAEIDVAKVPADRPERAAADVAAWLAKLGASEFAARKVDLLWSRPLHLSAQQINGLRRSTARALAARRAEDRPRPTPAKALEPIRFPEPELDFRANVLNRKAAAFYQRHGVCSIEPACESGLDLTGRVVMTTRYCLKHEHGLCPRAPGPEPHPTWPEPWHLRDDQGRKLGLRFRCDLDDCGMEIVYGG